MRSADSEHNRRDVGPGASEDSVIYLKPRPPQPTAPVLLRVPQAAQRLQVSERTLWRWVRAGTVPYVRLGDDERIVRIPVDLLDEWWRRRLEGAS